jgi:hypothetical protein
VLKAADEKHSPPAPAVVTAELGVVVQARHTGHDVADAAPVVEAPMQCDQLRLGGLHGKEAERGAQKFAAGV